MTIKKSLEKAINILKEHNIEQPILHSRLLLEFVLKKDKMYLIVSENNEIDSSNAKIFFEYVNQLAKRNTFSIYNKSSRIYEIRLLC